MMIPAVRWSPGSGRLVKRGSSDSATFMRNVGAFARPAAHPLAHRQARRPWQQLAEQQLGVHSRATARER
jgi:hypothetical protein